MSCPDEAKPARSSTAAARIAKALTESVLPIAQADVDLGELVEDRVLR
jgi:hypothetical protein